MTNYGVITICLNSASTINRCVESVLGQSRPPSHYVLVDGGSTDGTLDVLRDVPGTAAQRDPGMRVSVLQQTEPKGIAAAWNMGLEHLDTDLVFILNSDDWYDPRAAEVVLDLFQKHPDADIVVSPIRMVSDNDIGRKSIASVRPFLLFPFLMPVMHPGCFVKRETYSSIGTFDQSYRVSADYDFVYRCRKSGKKFIRYPNPIVNMQAGGMAGENRETARHETLTIARRHCSLPMLPLVAYWIRCLCGR